MVSAADLINGGHKPPAPDCDECGSSEVSYIYNTETSLWGLKCCVCRAYVSCHSGTFTPMGHMANVATRRLRKKLHVIADPLWVEGLISRDYMYVLISAAIDRPEAHIADMSDEELRTAIDFFTAYIAEKRDVLIRRKAKRDAKRRKIEEQLERE